ncbi:MAG TPA: C25 family cysteine peptidase, partial [Thermoflexales bacterium]|nr:C25 family cysteine peptidase [Thermoflexales bacterium]
LNTLYPTTPSITSTQIMSTLAQLAAHPLVNGLLLDLDGSQTLRDAYAQWDAQPASPLAANVVANKIKSLLFTTAPSYPALKYLVVIGDDRVIPHARLRDDALVANERSYAVIAASQRLSTSLAARYYLSDDYYASLIPLPFLGRELYRPTLAIGRLVERPDQMASALSAFLDRPKLAPKDAYVTGYDFLIDEATVISATLRGRGLTVTGRINNTWTAADFGADIFSKTVAPGLMSFNGHFEHYRFFPFNLPDITARTFVQAATSYSGTLAYSVGCHSGLNVPDNIVSATLRTDWPQAFVSENALWVGNTGYGYGDSDLIAYSERLMELFTRHLGDQPDMPVGLALQRAKTEYLLEKTIGGMSNYDEKTMAISTLYGLPMQRITLPPAAAMFGPFLSEAFPQQPAKAQVGGMATTTLGLDFAFVTVTTPQGSLLRLVGDPNSGDLVLAGRATQPRASRVITSPAGMVAHGALLLGGTFNDIPNFDPNVSRIVTEQLYLPSEPGFPTASLFPAVLGNIVRLLQTSGAVDQQLNVVPAQFIATTTATPTIGVERAYRRLDYAIYHAPFEDTDFIPPSIRVTTAFTSSGQIIFAVKADDTRSAEPLTPGEITRVLVLYRRLGAPGWTLLEPGYNVNNDVWFGSIPANGVIEYFAQAVDASGNVATALDYGNPFRIVTPWIQALPIVAR